MTPHYIVSSYLLGIRYTMTVSQPDCPCFGDSFEKDPSSIAWNVSQSGSLMFF